MPELKSWWRSLEPWQRAELVVAAFLAVEMAASVLGGYAIAVGVCRG
jgi:hypothetical protein